MTTIWQSLLNPGVETFVPDMKRYVTRQQLEREYSALRRRSAITGIDASLRMNQISKLLQTHF